MNYLLPTPLTAAALAILAIFFAVGGYGLGLWQDDMPGAGLLPFITALLLLPLIARVAMERTPDEEPFRLRPLGAVALLGVYALILPKLGFLLPTFLLIVMWVRIFDQQPWWLTTLVAAALTVGGVLIFVVLLKVPMPIFPRFS